MAQLAFPRYGESVHADLIRDGLHGRLGGFGQETYGMAMLFALDRLDAAPAIRARCEANDVVLLDRYVASNAAFGAARLRQDAHGEFVEWVRALDIERFAVPVPDAHLLLRVPVDVAARRGRRTARGWSRTAGATTWESDAELQARVAGGLRRPSPSTDVARARETRGGTERPLNPGLPKAGRQRSS